VSVGVGDALRIFFIGVLPPPLADIAHACIQKSSKICKTYFINHVWKDQGFTPFLFFFSN